MRKTDSHAADFAAGVHALGEIRPWDQGCTNCHQFRAADQIFDGVCIHCHELELQRQLATQLKYHLGMSGVNVTDADATNVAAHQVMGVSEWIRCMGRAR